MKQRPSVYEPMTVARLGTPVTGVVDTVRWRLVAEFLEEYGWEPIESRAALLEDEPAATGDEHWDVFLTDDSVLLDRKAIEDAFRRLGGR